MHASSRALHTQVGPWHKIGTWIDALLPSCYVCMGRTAEADCCVQGAGCGAAQDGLPDDAHEGPWGYALLSASACLCESACPRA
jgi:hypothetical protein